MMSKKEDQDAIQVRGRIYSSDTCFSLCSAAPEKKVFQTMVDLANEAISIREYLKRYGAKHKLAAMLSGQSSVESISFLMGATHQDVVIHQGSGSSDKSSVSIPESSDKVNEHLPAPGITGQKDVTHVSHAALQLDDDMLDAYSSFPGLQV